MVIFDRLEISPDGKKLYLDVHISDADYYKDVQLKDICINTEEDFLESGRNAEKSIYTAQFETIETPETLTILNNSIDKIIGTIQNPIICEDLEFPEDNIFLSEATDSVQSVLVQGGATNSNGDFFIDVQINGEEKHWFIPAKIGTEIPLEYQNSVDDSCSLHITEAASTPPRKACLIIDINDVLTLDSFSNHVLFVYIGTTGIPSACTPCGQDDIDTLGVTFDTGLIYNIGLKYIKELADKCNVPQGFTDFILNWEGFKLLIESEHYIDAIKLFNKVFKQDKSSIANSNCGCHGKVFG